MDAKNRLINTDTQAWHDDPGYAPLKQLRQTNVDMEVFVVERRE